MTFDATSQPSPLPSSSSQDAPRPDAPLPPDVTIVSPTPRQAPLRLVPPPPLLRRPSPSRLQRRDPGQRRSQPAPSLHPSQLPPAGVTRSKIRSGLRSVPPANGPSELHGVNPGSPPASSPRRVASASSNSIPSTPPARNVSVIRGTKSATTSQRTLRSPQTSTTKPAKHHGGCNRDLLALAAAFTVTAIYADTTVWQIASAWIAGAFLTVAYVARGTG